MSKLIIQRSKKHFGRYRILKIKICSDLVIAMSPGQTQTIEIPKGSYSIEARMDWGRSTPLQLTINEDETKKVYADSIFLPLALLKCFIPPFKMFTLNEIK